MKPARRARKLLLALASFALALVLAEATVRLWWDPRPLEMAAQREALPLYYQLVEGGLLERDADEALRYHLHPGFELELHGKTYRIDTLGLRGPEIPARRPAGVRRVVVLGDSYAFGLGVDQNKTLAAQLQERLRARERSIEVLNLGVPGYHGGQELAHMERSGWPLDPALVVLLYYANDEIGEAFHYDPAWHLLYGDTLPLPYALKGLLARSAIYRRLTRALTDRQRDSGELKAMDPRHWPVTRRRLEALIATCKARRVPLLIANLPFMTGTYDLKNPKWPFLENYQRIGALAEERSVPWVDLRAVLLRSTDYIERFFVSIEPPRDNHLNARGYAVIARAIDAAIAADALLP